MTTQFPISGGIVTPDQFTKLITFNFAGAEGFTFDIPPGFYHLGFIFTAPGTIVGSPTVAVKNWANSAQTTLNSTVLSMCLNGAAPAASITGSTGIALVGFLDPIINSNATMITPVVFVPYGLKIYSTAGTSGTGYFQIFAQRVC